MRTWTMLCGAAALLLAGEAPAQSPRDLLQIEIAAAQHALSGGNIARNMIQVEPRYAGDREVPGSPGGRARPAERTAAIQDAVTVPSTYRRPYGETLLLMSEPKVSGDAAEVTTTIYRSSQSGRRIFVTTQVRLVRADDGWRVAGAERLGGEED